MEGPVRGEVFRAPFRFSDLSGSKERPVLVLCALSGEDVIVCQITSKRPAVGKFLTIPSQSDLSFGNFPLYPSYIRPLRLATLTREKLGQRIASIHARLTIQALEVVAEAFNPAPKIG